jgi:hypothetical protein
MGRIVLIGCVAFLALISPAGAHHKPGHHMPPGQMKKLYDPQASIPAQADYVCLVTTSVDGDPYSRVVYTEWLPRSDAEQQAEQGKGFLIYHASVNTEEGCTGFR